MFRRLGPVASVGLFLALFIVLNLGLMWMDVWRQFPGTDQAIYRSRNLGLGAGYLFLMSLPSAAGFGITLAVANAWRHRRNRPAIVALWVPLTSAVLAVGLTYTAVPNMLLALTDILLGPDSMWMLVTWPFGQAATAAGVCVVIAMVGRRSPSVTNSDMNAG